MTKIEKIAVHAEPHQDEVVALMMLLRFPQAEREFPGVSTARVVEFVEGYLPENKTFRDFPNTLFVGCGGGDLDEHNVLGRKGKEDECSATLVAERLDLLKDRGLEMLLYFTQKEDLEISRVPDTVSFIIKLLHDQNPGQPGVAIEWAEVMDWALYLEQTEIWEQIQARAKEVARSETTVKSEEEIAEMLWGEEKKKWKTLTLHTGHKLFKRQYPDHADAWRAKGQGALDFQKAAFEAALKEINEKLRLREATQESLRKPDAQYEMLTIVSDSREIIRAARKMKFEIIVQRNSTGNTQIFTQQHNHPKFIYRNLDLTVVAALWRQMEAGKRGLKVKTMPNLWSQSGSIPGVPMIFLHDKGGMILNGSKTAQKVEPTILTLEEIRECVHEGLRQRNNGH